MTTAVAGSVCLSTPFKLMERPFLRDVIFYIASGFWAFCIFYKGSITLGDSLGTHSQNQNRSKLQNISPKLSCVVGTGKKQD